MSIENRFLIKFTLNVRRFLMDFATYRYWWWSEHKNQSQCIDVRILHFITTFQRFRSNRFEKQNIVIWVQFFCKFIHLQHDIDMKNKVHIKFWLNSLMSKSSGHDLFVNQFSLVCYFQQRTNSFLDDWMSLRFKSFVVNVSFTDKSKTFNDLCSTFTDHF